MPGVASLSADDPVTEHAVPGAPPGVRVRAVVNAPAAGVLRLDRGPGEQLVLALDGDAAPPHDAARTAGGAPAPGDTGAAGDAAAPAAGATPAAVATAAARPTPPPPATLSYSALARYAECPYRFHLERGLGLPSQEPPAHLRDAGGPAAPGLDPLVRGTLVHELLEGLRAGPPAAEDVRALAAAREVELQDAEVADLLTMVRAFAESAVNRRLEAATDVRREHGFAFPLGAGGPLVNGFVDVLATEPDGTALVLDYKSDDAEGIDLEQAVEASYGAQRRIYALACLRAGAPAAEVVHVFLQRADAPVSRRYAAADAAALERELQALAAGLLAGEYPVAETPHRGLCATCPGRAGLCSWAPDMTDRTLADAAEA